ncbi:MAG: protein kinase [Myxococcales bacterium]|nr:protein kinase [Myxococcales bacterium]
MDDRRTLRSGLPVELRRELEGLVGALLAVAKTEGVPGRLRVERLLGHGALFVTFAATRIDRRGAMPVALKVLRPSIALAWPEGPRILSREQARLVAILNERVPPSPHVVRLLEAGELGREPSRGLDLEVPYLTLELVPAPLDVADASLFTRVRLEVTTHGFALDAKTALGVLRGVAKGLDLVHGHGLLHRGLGPTNVLMVGDVARVSDLAIARPSGLPPGFGVLTDTPAHVPDAYRAPEQRQGAAPTPAVDVFAFAALARFVLTGRPGQALVTANTLHPSLANPERRAALVALEAALDLGLAADPEQRPATIESFFRTLEPALETLARGVRVVRPPTPQPALAGWVWTVRHEPRAKLAGVMRAVVDEEGRALLLAREPAASSERATDGLDVTAPENRSAHFFDGRLYRPVPPIPELDTAVVATHHDGAWVVFGRGTDGRGAAAKLEAGAQRALPPWPSAAVCAAFLDHRLAFVDGHGRLVVDGVPIATLSGLACAYALSKLDDELAVVVGMATNGGPYLAAIDLTTHEVQTQPWPARSLGFCMARDRRTGAALVGCAHGLVVDLRRATGLRVVATPTQLPLREDVQSVAFDPSGAAWVGVRGAAWLRTRASESFVLAHADPTLDDVLAIAPRPRGCLLFTRSGTVLEGRDLLPTSV